MTRNRWLRDYSHFLAHHKRTWILGILALILAVAAIAWLTILVGDAADVPMLYRVN